MTKVIKNTVIIVITFLLIGCETVIRNDAPNLGKKLEAAKNADQIVKVENLDEYGRINFQMAREYANSSEIDLAAQKLAITLKRYPKFPEGYNLQGVIEEQRGRFDAAQASYKKAFELDPNYAEAFGHYAYIICKKGLSVIDSNSAKNISFGLYAAAGECALSKNQLSQALSYADEAIRLNAQYGQSYYVKAAAYKRMGNLESSLNALEQYHNINGYNPESLQIGLQIAEQAGNEPAINLYKSALTQFINP